MLWFNKRNQRAKFFSIYTDRSWPVNNIFIYFFLRFSESNLICEYTEYVRSNNFNCLVYVCVFKSSILNGYSIVFTIVHASYQSNKINIRLFWRSVLMVQRNWWSWKAKKRTKMKTLVDKARVKTIICMNQDLWLPKSYKGQFFNAALPAYQLWYSHRWYSNPESFAFVAPWKAIVEKYSRSLRTCLQKLCKIVPWHPISRARRNGSKIKTIFLELATQAHKWKCFKSVIFPPSNLTRKINLPSLQCLDHSFLSLRTKRFCCVFNVSINHKYVTKWIKTKLKSSWCIYWFSNRLISFNEKR